MDTKTLKSKGIKHLNHHIGHELSNSINFERDKKIFIDMLSGKTSKEMASQHGISQARIGQIANHYLWVVRRRISGPLPEHKTISAARENPVYWIEKFKHFFC